MKNIYLPMSADIITVGHIKIIKKCAKLGKVFIGLLSERGLKGYKKCVVPYLERKEILENIKGVERVLPQHSLNMTHNIKAYSIDAVVSGDGWEKKELESIEKTGCKIIDIRLKGEKQGQKLYSSTKLKKLICQKE